MVYIKVVGLDQFIVGRISRDYTAKIANLYEMDEDDINFVAPSCMIFHKGVEQTSWHIMINVLAPKKVMVLQDQMTELIKAAFKNVTINMDLVFSYYSEDDFDFVRNNDYPRYISDDNLVTDDIEYEDIEDEDDIFDGDIFESVKGSLK